MKRISLILVLTALLAALATPALADGPEGDVVIWGDNYTLESGERLSGDLLVYAGDVDLESGSQVNGDVTLFGGNLEIKGEIEGDVTVWGGNVSIRSSATIRGQVVAVGGNILREEGATVRGGEIEGFPFKLPNPPKPPTPPRAPQLSVQADRGNQWLRHIAQVFRSAFGMLVMIILGILVVVFIPSHTDTVAETIIKAPLQSFLTGLAAVIVVPIVAIVLTVTIVVGIGMVVEGKYLIHVLVEFRYPVVHIGVLADHIPVGGIMHTDTVGHQAFRQLTLNEPARAHRVMDKQQLLGLTHIDIIEYPLLALQLMA